MPGARSCVASSAMGRSTAGSRARAPWRPTSHPRTPQPACGWRSAKGLLAGITTVHDWAHNVLSSDDADANVTVHRELGLRAHWTYGAPSGSPLLSADQMKAHAAKVGKECDEPMDFDDIRRIRDECGPRRRRPAQRRASTCADRRASRPEVYRLEFAHGARAGPAHRDALCRHAPGGRAHPPGPGPRRRRPARRRRAAGPLHLAARPRSRRRCARHGVPISISPMVRAAPGHGAARRSASCTRPA